VLLLRVVPSRTTRITAPPGGMFSGIWKLICPAELKKIVAA
jgi:hypothetical protein